MSGQQIKIRGLYNFIVAIRNCKNTKQENDVIEKEKAKIRKCFGKKSVDGYSKKKYLWKIMYMYMMGYSVDFGHLQCIELLSSTVYSEKAVGYISVGMLLIEHSDFLRLCIQTIQKDLESRDDTHQCLALQTICNVGSQDFAEALAPHVTRVLTNGVCTQFVRKKACLALLRLVRKYPDVQPEENQVPKIISVMEESNPSLVHAGVNLIIGLASHSAKLYRTCIPKLVQQLHRFVIRRECPRDYMYYRTPCPWLQVKLLRLLQYFPPPSNTAEQKQIHDCLERILQKTEVTQSVNKNNADHAILFEAVNTIIHFNIYEWPILHEQAVSLLVKFISVKEPNIRYLGLDTTARLAKIQTTHGMVKKYLKTIQFSLDDADISIRHRALELIYSICDEENSREVVDHLVKYLVGADHALREELVTKISILAEKYVPETSEGHDDWQWYVEVIISLIATAGDFITDEIWHRVVQIITNQENCQKFAAEKVFECLNEPPVHEALVKIAAYTLGEFCDSLEDIAPQRLFDSLHAHFYSSSNATKAILLSTYMKFATIYEALRPQLLDIFRLHQDKLDQELQQRSVEYAAMVSHPDQAMIQNKIWQAMPEFPDRENTLAKKLKLKTEVTADRNIWTSDDHKVEWVDEAVAETRDDSSSSSSGESDGSSSSGEDNEKAPSKPTGTRAQVPAATTTAPAPNFIDDLFGSGASADAFGGGSGGGGDGIVTHQQDPDRMVELLTQPDGVLHEDANVQIGFKSQVDHASGTMKVKLYYGNKSTSVLDQVRLVVDSTDEMKIDLRPNEAFSIPPKDQVQQFARCQCLKPFDELPGMTISWKVGAATHTMTGRFPVLVTKFVAPLVIASRNEYLMRWNAVKNEQQSDIKLRTPLATERLKEALSTQLGYKVYDKFDTNPNNAVCSGLLHTASKNNGVNVTVPSLLRVQLAPDQMTMRVTTRSTHGPTSSAVLQSCRAIFGSWPY